MCSEKPGLLNLRHRQRTRGRVQTTFPAKTDANLEKWNEGHKEQAATPEHRYRWAEELGEKNLKRQAEVEAEFHVEEEKAAEIKNQVQTAKNSPDAQQYRAAAALMEVADRSAVKVSKFQAAERAQERSRTQREDGKQDAWNRR